MKTVLDDLQSHKLRLIESSTFTVCPVSICLSDFRKKADLGDVNVTWGVSRYYSPVVWKVKYSH